MGTAAALLTTLATGSAVAAPAMRPAPLGAYTSILVHEDGAPRPLLPGTVVQLEFTGGRLVASAGCNTMAGAVEVTNDAIVVGDLAVTRMGCEPARHQQDLWLETFLESDPGWSFGGGVLTLRSAGTELLLGERLPAVARQPLFNRYWIVDTVLGDRVVYPVPPGIHVSLLFREASGGGASGGGASAGAVSGDMAELTGILICNWLSGTAVVGDDTLTMAGVGTTKRACPQGDPRVETGVMRALTGTSRYWFDGDQLTIAQPTGPGLVMHAAF